MNQSKRFKLKRLKFVRNTCAGFLFIIFLTALDQYTKYLAQVRLKDHAPFEIIPGVLELRYLDGGNSGAAWGILAGKTWLFIILTALIIVFLLAVTVRIEYLLQNVETGINDSAASNFQNSARAGSLRANIPVRILQLLLVVMTSGALGNLIDRVDRGYVIDFIYFKLINFPIFNVADCYVTLSAVGIAVICLFFLKDEDFANIFSFRRKNR